MHTDNIMNILQRVKTFTLSQDGTYSIETEKLVEYEDGFQVSFVRDEAFTELSEDGWDTITRYLCGYLDSIAHIGVYGSEPEVSFHTMNKSRGESVMKTYNQESMLDWEMKKIYPTMQEYWFIYNRFFDKEKKVNYEKILKSIL